MKKILNAALVGALICSAFVMLAGCEPTAGTPSTGTDPTTTTPTDETPAADPTPPVTIPCKVDFESANIAKLATDGFLAEIGDMRDGAINDMKYEADTSVLVSGAASLKATATVYQNRYSPNAAQWVFNIDLAKAGATTPVNLEGKTMHIKAYVPADSGINAVKLVLVGTGGVSQGKGIVITAKDAWQDISYKYVGTIPCAAEGGSDTSDYTNKDFDVREVTAIKVVALKNFDPSYTVVAADEVKSTVYLDCIDWD